MRRKTVIYLLSGCLLVMLIQFLATDLFPNFAGTDDRSVELIQQIAPQYQPWAKHLIEFKQPWAEPVLFALQAIIGLSVVAYFVWKQSKKKA
ncbi:energy-coupling factor ABC transporter substrate-binding protein [Mangrovibacterium lignilyticum]|uniref:energy-coupling factor ABC transporter substrate-binding protein n=1 Tax=Mangrovibacterium lignilyticum TaxID=2668052 RepID=UPI0013D2FA7C|nr:energy-coupling factor ABC transporter substrate-binding protein [Mangrovibacterium lignilyticum]